jgi:hypothetical protein
MLAAERRLSNAIPRAAWHGHFFPNLRFHFMKKYLSQKIEQAGAAGYILLWLIGVPVPVLAVIFLLRGCT